MPAIVLRAQDLGYAYPQRRLFHQLSFELPAGLSLVRGATAVAKPRCCACWLGSWPAMQARCGCKASA